MDEHSAQVPPKLPVLLETYIWRCKDLPTSCFHANFKNTSSGLWEMGVVSKPHIDWISAIAERKDIINYTEWEGCIEWGRRQVKPLKM